MFFDSEYQIAMELRDALFQLRDQLEEIAQIADNQQSRAPTVHDRLSEAIYIELLLEFADRAPLTSVKDSQWLRALARSAWVAADEYCAYRLGGADDLGPPRTEPTAE